MKHLGRMLVGLILLLLAVPSAFAQFDTATVVGTVKDNTGGVVPGATVTLTNRDTGIAAVKVTDANGNYEFMTVHIGRYKVSAELSGFATAVADGIQVAVGARQRVDLQLSPGQVSETVQVTGTSVLLETDSSQRGHLISSKQAVELPLNGREYSALALLTPGVRLSSLNTGSSTTNREGAFNVNGMRSTFNNFLLDGLDNNSYGTSNQGFSNQVLQPSPDAVAEFKVVTNNMSAEFGRSGGATVNVALKSGTNRFTGSAWEFFRNTAMNATGFFKPTSGRKPDLERNQFGGTFGGPIVRNKAFFFGDSEVVRQDRKLVTYQTIPTALERQGILSVAVRNPQTGITYPAGTPIPMTDFARKVLSGLPNPTRTGTGNNYDLLRDFRYNTYKYNGKVDYQVNQRLSLFARYGYRNMDSHDQPELPLPSGGGGNGNIYVRAKQLGTGFTWSRTGTSLLEGRFGWSKTEAGKNPPGLGSDPIQSMYGITGLPTESRISGGLNTQLFGGYSQFGRQETNPQWQYPTVFTSKLNYTWIVNKHSLKAGYEFQYISTEVQDVNPLYGRDTYSGQFTKPTGAASNNLYNIADFMFGLRSQYALSNILIAHLRQRMQFGYLQDDFRVNSKLTLNMGLRYEYATPQWEKDNLWSNFDKDQVKMITAKDGSIFDRATIHPDRNNWAPRLGFAYTLMPRTVVRGGYGVSYIHFNRIGAANVLAINGPQVVNAVVTQNSPTSPTFRTTQEGYPADFASPSKFDPLLANVTYMPNNYHSTMVQSTYVSVQRELASNMMIDVAYVHNQADGMMMVANYNQAVPNNVAASQSLQSRRPIPTFGDITYVWNGGKSRYNGLQVKFDYRMRGGILFMNSLTISKAKDNGPGALENSNAGNVGPQNFYDMNAEYATSNYDQPFNNTFSFVWELPFGHGRRWANNIHPVLNAFIGGWTFSGINTNTSGAPATLVYAPQSSWVVSGISQEYRGSNTYRPNVSGDPYGDKKSVTSYLSSTNVTLPTDAAHVFGNAKRNSVRLPNFWQTDFVASKNFGLGGQRVLQFRFEAFNLLNHTNFQGLSTTRSSSNFGTITSTYDARQLQLGIKLTF